MIISPDVLLVISPKQCVRERVPFSPGSADGAVLGASSCETVRTARRMIAFRVSRSFRDGVQSAALPIRAQQTKYDHVALSCLPAALFVQRLVSLNTFSGVCFERFGQQWCAFLGKPFRRGEEGYAAKRSKTHTHTKANNRMTRVKGQSS